MNAQMRWVGPLLMALCLAGCPLEQSPQAGSDDNDAQPAHADAARPAAAPGNDADLPQPDAAVDDPAADLGVPDASPPEPGTRCLNDTCSRRLTRDALILEAPDGALTRLVGRWTQLAGALHAEQITIPAEAASLRLAPAALVYSIEDDTLSGWAVLHPPEGFGGAPTRIAVALADADGHAWAEDAPFRQAQRLYLAITFEADGAALGHGLEVSITEGSHALLDGASGRSLFEAVNVTLPGLGQQHAAPFSVAPAGAVAPVSVLHGPEIPPRVELGFAGTARLPGPVRTDGWIYIAAPGTPNQQILTHGHWALTHASSGLALQVPDGVAVSDGHDTAFSGTGPPWALTPLMQQLEGSDDGLVTGHSGENGSEVLYDGPLSLGAVPLLDATLRFDPATIELDAQIVASPTLGPWSDVWPLALRGPVSPDGTTRLAALNPPALALGPFRARQPVLAHDPDGTSVLAALDLPGVEGSLTLRASHQAARWPAVATGAWRLAGVAVNEVRIAGEAATVTGQAQIAAMNFALSGTLIDGRPALSGTGQLQMGEVLLDPLTVQLGPNAGALNGPGMVPGFGAVVFTATLMGEQPLVFTGPAELDVLHGRVAPGQFSFEDTLRYAGTARITGLAAVAVQGAWNRGFYQLSGPLQLQLGGFTLADARLALTPQSADIVGTLTLPFPILVQIPMRGAASNAIELSGSPVGGQLVLAGHTLTQATVMLSREGAALTGTRTLQGRSATLVGPVQPNGQYLLRGPVPNFSLAGFPLRNTTLELQPAGLTLSATAVLIAEFAMRGSARADGSIQLNGQRRTADVQASVRSCVGNACVVLRSCTLRDGVAALELRDQAWSARYTATCCAPGLPCFGVDAAISLQGRSCINLVVGNVCLQVL